MNEHTEDVPAREVQAWPLATLEELRKALFDGDVGQETMADVHKAIVDGRLIDAGRITEDMASNQIIADAKAALGKGRLPSPGSVLPMIFSLSVDNVEQANLMIVRPMPEDKTKARAAAFTARRDPAGRIRLVQLGALAESGEQRNAIHHGMAQLSVWLRYLSLKTSLEPVRHSSGVAYSRLDVAKATRFLMADKPSAKRDSYHIDTLR
jgi:hypothetical protein